MRLALRRLVLVLAIAVIGIPWPGVSRAADEEDDFAIIAKGEIDSSGVSGTFSFRPGVVGIFQPVVGEPLMRLKYRLWVLVGEPVWAFVGKAPRLARINLTAEDGVIPFLTIAARGNLPDGTVHWNGHDHVTVSRDLMDMARIYDFSFQAVLRRDALNRLPAALRQGKPEADTIFDDVSIYRAYQGLLGQPGEWGWTVPGSPDWGETFTRRGMVRPSFARDSFKEHLLGREEAKEVMRRLLYNYHDRGLYDYSEYVRGQAPIVHLETGDFRVHIYDLLRAIRRAEPEALHLLDGVRSVYDEELSRIVSDFADDVRREGLTEELAREAEEIDAVVSSHRERLSDAVVAAWRDVRANAPAAAADRRAAAYLRDLGPQVAARLSEWHLELPSGLDDDLEKARAFFAADPPVSDAVKAKWRALEDALDPGGGDDLVAQRYRDHGNGTVTDVVTGLQWMLCTYGREFVEWPREAHPGKHVRPRCEGDRKRVYVDTLPRPGEVSFAGHSDWRVPTIEELETLVYCRHWDHPDYYRMMDNPAPERPTPGYCYDFTGHTYRDYTNYSHTGVFDITTIGDDVSYLSSTSGVETDSAGGTFNVMYSLDFRSGNSIGRSIYFNKKSERVSSNSEDYYLLLVRNGK
ncbi:DUF1566 domain-containing protein [Ferruginivarius sediminum]|uniref:DUF1566 domain-containing protein n=1 Tax=Ferruginivarius sediminum TaxID=2661937 RepID=A0A369TCQ5_9PROT|nr:DUF1566 domain-containing protein [Ferruginivarius sediminum]RDD63131.1 DUF1566 domain-containing protein [Ferruginivarius sediminum]